VRDEGTVDAESIEGSDALWRGVVRGKDYPAWKDTLREPAIFLSRSETLPGTDESLEDHWTLLDFCEVTQVLIRVEEDPRLTQVHVRESEYMNFL
jgi:hypothetical protein